MFLKKIAADNYSFPIEKFYDGLKKLERLNVLYEKKARNHYTVRTTEYFKNNLLNTKVLDPLPDGTQRSLENGVVIRGKAFTLFATLDIKKEEIYGGSATSWEALLVSLYILSKPNSEGKQIKRVISEVFKNCFITDVTNSIFYKELNLEPMLNKSRDIIINNNLLLNDYVIDYIKSFKERLYKDSRINISNDLKIIEDNYFTPYINGALPEDRSAAVSEVEDAKSKLKEIFTNLTEAVFDLPKITGDIISKSFKEDMSVIASFIEETPGTKNLFSLDELFLQYCEAIPDNVTLFKNKYIADEEDLDDVGINNEMKKIFKQELDKLINSGEIFSKEGDELYSILALKNRVLTSLGKLYRLLPPIEKRAVLIEALRYSRGW